MRTHCIGLILAGGSGQRLGGVEKHRLRLQQRTLLDHALARLAPQCDTLLLSVSARQRLVESDNLQLAVLPDSEKRSFGPVSGLSAAAHWCARHAPESFLVTMAVDTPLLPLDFADRCIVQTGGKKTGVAMVSGQVFPTHAVWPPSARTALLDVRFEGNRGPSLWRTVDESGCDKVSFDDYLPQNPFSGVNTLADMLALSRCLQRSSVLL